jgi:nucleoside-diphosphate-sugar epimerase
MNLLLTGAAGFTGRLFAQKAVQAGHTVHPLQADLTNKAAVSAEVTPLAIDAVVHLAAISFVGHADDAAFYAVNTIGTLNLLSALAAMPQRPQRVLLASSANVYGNCETSPIAETQMPAPVNHYAMSKLAMEHMARTYADRLPLIIARPFNYTGPGQEAQFLIPKLVGHFVRRESTIELGNLHVEREFNDVRMVCDAYLSLLQHGRPGETYNICSGHPYSLTDTLALLTRLTGHTPQVRVNPALVRANEVHRLCGSAEKLHACLPALQHHKLEDTLQWMLSEAARGVQGR